GDVKDASLKAGPSTEGIVIEKQLFARTKKDQDKKALEKEELKKLDEEHAVVLNELKTRLIDKLQTVLEKEKSAGVRTVYNEEVVKPGTKFTKELLKNVDYSIIDYSSWTEDEERNKLISRMLHNYSIKVNEEVGRYKRENFNISIGDELPAGVLKLAKVY